MFEVSDGCSQLLQSDKHGELCHLGGDEFVACGLPEKLLGSSLKRLQSTGPRQQRTILPERFSEGGPRVIATQLESKLPKPFSN